MEARIVKLYRLLDKDIMPWMWDWENYTGDKADMVGFFYPEDINAIMQIQELENEGEKRKQK